MSRSKQTNPIDADALEKQLERFTQLSKPFLDRLAAISPRVAQLAFTFPLLFATLSLPLSPYERRKQAIALTVDGASLTDIAACIGLPRCLRSIPPEACPKVPIAPWTLAASPLISPYIPTDAALTRTWLLGINYAHHHGDEGIACWVARRPRLFVQDLVHPYSLLPVIMFAWHDQHCPDLAPQAPRWSRRIEFRTAIERTTVWLKMVKAKAELGDGIIDDWLPPATDRSLTILPLTTAEDLVKEGQSMYNCIVEYAEAVGRNISRVYSIRRNGVRIATLEIKKSPTTDRPFVHQLQGSGNSKLPLDIVMAVHTYVGFHGRPITTPKHAKTPGVDERFKSMLGPYRAARSETIYYRRELPALDDLRSSLRALSLLAGIQTHWMNWD